MKMGVLELSGNDCAPSPSSSAAGFGCNEDINSEASLWILPNELTVQIWQLFSYNEVLKLSEVCRRWRQIFFGHFFRRSEFCELRLYVFADHYELVGWKPEDKVIRLDRSISSLRRHFSLTKLAIGTHQAPYRTCTCNGTLGLFFECEPSSSEASTERGILNVLLEQAWNIRHFELNGLLTGILHENLLQFFQMQRQNVYLCNVDNFSVKHAAVTDGFISDKLLKLLRELDVFCHIDLEKICPPYSMSSPVSNASLRHLLRPHVSCTLPYPLANRITNGALLEALEHYFSAQEPLPFTRNCKLQLHANSDVSFESVGSLRIANVETLSVCRCGAHRRHANWKEHQHNCKARQGRIYFTSCRHGKLSTAEIVVMDN